MIQKNIQTMDTADPFLKIGPGYQGENFRKVKELEQIPNVVTLTMSSCTVKHWPCKCRDM